MPRWWAGQRRRSLEGALGIEPIQRIVLCDLVRLDHADVPVGEFEREATGDGAAGVLDRLKRPAPAGLVARNVGQRLGDEPA